MTSGFVNATNGSSGKLAMAKFLNFKMVDSKPIMEQVEALQLLKDEINSEGIVICEPFMVSHLIEKLPPSWLDFIKPLTFTKQAISLEDLIVELRVESQNRNANVVLFHENIVNMADHRRKPKNKILSKASSSFKKRTIALKFFGKFVKCAKMSHKTKLCRKKAKTLTQANLTEYDLCAVVTEANLADEETKGWIYDTGATAHICYDRAMFSTYQKNKSDARMKMGNTSVSKIKGTGKVVLKFTSSHEITLTNVRHVPDMRKNLISGTLMILRKNVVFLGKGYEGLVKMLCNTILKNFKSSCV